MARIDNPATRIGDGRQVVTTAGTRVQLSSTSVECREVAVTAETDNTGAVVVGNGTVIAALATRRGTPLNAGDTVIIAVDNLTDVWIDATVSTDGVTFTYEV